MALPLRMAVTHTQFEAIHPFGDGNGRVGRLLPALTMAAEGLSPLYLAGYLKVQQRESYALLADVHLQGRWVPWLEFFLEGIVAAAATEQATAKALLGVRQGWQGRSFQAHEFWPFWSAPEALRTRNLRTRTGERL